MVNSESLQVVPCGIGNHYPPPDDPQSGTVYAEFSLAAPNGAAPVPEPATLAIWALLGVCGMGVGWGRRKLAA